MSLILATRNEGAAATRWHLQGAYWAVMTPGGLAVGTICCGEPRLIGTKRYETVAQAEEAASALAATALRRFLERMAAGKLPDVEV